MFSYCNNERLLTSICRRRAPSRPSRCSPPWWADASAGSIDFRDDRRKGGWRSKEKKMETTMDQSRERRRAEKPGGLSYLCTQTGGCAGLPVLLGSGMLAHEKTTLQFTRQMEADADPASTDTFAPRIMKGWLHELVGLGLARLLANVPANSPTKILKLFSWGSQSLFCL